MKPRNEHPLQEITIRSKLPAGSGDDHTVFPLEGHPDRLVKVRYKRNYGGNTIKVLPIDKSYFKTMQAHPDIFCRVYKISARFAIIERLDVAPVKADILKLQQLFREADPEKHFEYLYVHANTLITNLYITISEQDGIYNRFIIKVIKEHVGDDKTFEDYYNLLHRVWKEVPASEKHGVLDIHTEQLGYDHEGKLKLLDY